MTLSIQSTCMLNTTKINGYRKLLKHHTYSCSLSFFVKVNLPHGLSNRICKTLQELYMNVHVCYVPGPWLSVATYSFC